MTNRVSPEPNPPATLAKEEERSAQHTLGLNCRSMRWMGERLPLRRPQRFLRLLFLWTRQGKTTLNSGLGQPCCPSWNL